MDGIYENEEYVIRVEKLGSQYRAIMLKKVNNDGFHVLEFEEFIWDHDNIIQKMLIRMNFKKVNKFITLVNKPITNI